MNLRGKLVIFAILTAGSVCAHAGPVSLDASTQCSKGNAINGIVVGDVTGNKGGSSECWGTFDGNDPGPSGDGFDIAGESGTYNFVAKKDIGTGLSGTGLSGTDIGLTVSGTPGSSGGWAFNSTTFGPNGDGLNFIIVLKAANSPGFATWFFSGADAESFSGTWNVAWTNGGGNSPALSHLSVYSGPGTGPGGPGPGVVSEPSALALLGLGLLGLVLTRRRMPSAR